MGKGIRDYIKEIIQKTLGEQEKEAVRALIWKDHEFPRNGVFQGISERKWDYAERGVSSSTATGSDDTPMRLITSLHQKMKHKLREAVSRILTKGRVPEW